MYIFYVTTAIGVEVGYYSRYDRLLEMPYKFRALPSVSDGGAARTIDADTYAIDLLPPAPSQVTADNLYLATHAIFFNGLGAFQGTARDTNGRSPISLLTKAAEERILAASAMPRRLDNNGRTWSPLSVAMADLSPTDDVRICVINNFHGAFGDTLVHLAALAEVRRTLSSQYKHVEIDLLQHHCSREAQHLYEASRVVDQIRFLPAPLSLLVEYDGYFNMDGAEIPNNENWIDATMRLHAIDPLSVPRERKRLVVPTVGPPTGAAAAAIKHGRTDGRPILLFHPTASVPLRSCPAEEANRLVLELIENSDFNVACAVPLSVQHDRYLDWSSASVTFHDFVDLVAAVDVVVSTDTCAYHIAAGRDVPAVAIFPTIAPSDRIGYYPLVEGIALVNASEPIAGLSLSASPEHVAYAEECWHGLRGSTILAAVERVVERKAALARSGGNADSIENDDSANISGGRNA